MLFIGARFAVLVSIAQFDLVDTLPGVRAVEPPLRTTVLAAVLFVGVVP